MKVILILMFLGANPTITTAEFETHQACRTAAKTFTQNAFTNDAIYGPENFRWICADKGEK